MRIAFVLVSIACLLIGLSLGLISRGERLEDLPQRSIEIARGGNPTDAEAANAIPRQPAPRSSHPATFKNGPVRVAGILAQQHLTYEAEYGSTYPFFGMQNLTRVALEMDLAKHAQATGRRIVSMVPEESTVTRFVDDMNTELALEDSFGGPYEMSTQLSTNGLGLTVFVGSAEQAHPQATRLILEGSLALLCASDQQTVTSESAPFTKGSTFKVGDFEFELISTKASEWDEDKWEIELRTTASLDSVISWSLVDDKGEAFDLSESMTWTMNGTVNKTLVAPQEFATGSLRMEYWADGEVLHVPYSVSASLGMQ